MSYGGTKSQAGLGTIININTGTASSPTWTLVGEVTKWNQTGTMNKSDDATNLQSQAEEFIPVILSPGTYDGEMNRISGDAGQLAVRASFNAVPPTLAQYQVVLKKNVTQTTAGDSYVVTALVEEFSDLGSVEPTKIIKTKVRFKISGTIAFTAGS